MCGYEDPAAAASCLAFATMIVGTVGSSIETSAVATPSVCSTAGKPSLVVGRCSSCDCGGLYHSCRSVEKIDRCIYI